jgi:hypothetical protein
MDNFSPLLYEDSPFLPKITPVSFTQIKMDVALNKFPATFAIAKEIILIGSMQNKMHHQEFEFISENFDITGKNIDDFMFGFITPPTLIVGGYAVMTHGIVGALKLFCPPTYDEELIKHNAYKMYHLFHAYDIISKTQNHLPLSGAIPIYNLCKLIVFKDNYFYLAGLEASEMLFEEFSNLLYLH